MALRIVCLGSERSAAALRRAAATTGLATVVASLGPEDGLPAALAGVGPYDALCSLEAVPGLLDLTLAHGRGGSSVLVAGPPTEDPAMFDRLVAVFTQSRAALIVGGLLAQRPACLALRDSVAQGRVGAPVYLRYAAEAGDPASLFWYATDAIDLATQVLGEPADVYAAGTAGGAGALAHLNLTLRHHSGAVALLGLGVAPDTRGHASLLLLGDRGAVESDTAAVGLIVRDGAPAAAAYRLRDERAGDVATWLAAVVAALQDETARAAALARGRRLAAALAAVRRSLATSRPESLALW